MDSAFDGNTDWNVSTGLNIFNPRWYAMLGYEPGEVPHTYQKWKSLIHPDDLKVTEQKILDHISNSDQKYEVNFRMRTKQGQWVWVIGRGKYV